MHPDDAILQSCNETELLWLARRQGVGFLRRGLPRDTLIAIVSGEIEAPAEAFSPTDYTRWRLESFIAQNIARLRGQLPGCNGCCTSFMCTEGKHMSCFLPSEPLLL